MRPAAAYLKSMREIFEYGDICHELDQAMATGFDYNAPS